MNKALTDTLQTIQDETEGHKISFGDLVQALNHRGFGALLIGPALIVVLPTGAIPGVPLLCALMILLIAIQIVMGRRYPWLPKRLRNMSFNRQKFKAGVKHVKPYTEWIDGFFHERWKFLTEKPAQRVIAVICVILALSIIPFGLVPFASMLPAFAILIFGLSLSVHDGLLACFGFIVMAITLFVVPYYLM